MLSKFPDFSQFHTKHSLFPFLIYFDRSDILSIKITRRHATTPLLVGQGMLEARPISL